MTPEGLVRWYYRERDSFGPPGLNFVDSTGHVYNPKCSECEGKARKMRPDGVCICANHRCGALWKYVKRYIFKGEVQKSVRTDSFEHRHSRWIDVGVQLHRFLLDPRWRTCARVFVAYAMGFKIAEISAAASEELWGIKPGMPWSSRTVYRRKNEGRAEWMRRLVAAGIHFDL